MSEGLAPGSVGTVRHGGALAELKPFDRMVLGLNPALAAA